MPTATATRIPAPRQPQPQPHDQVIDLNDIKAASVKAWRRWGIAGGGTVGDLDDFESDCGWGAAKALTTWDPERGASLRTHAYATMEWACLDGMRSRSWTSRLDNGKVGADDAAVDVLHPRALPPVSLELPIRAQGGADSVVELVDVLPDEGGERPYREVEAARSVHQLLDRMRAVGHTREVDVLNLYFLRGHSLREIGEMWGVGESRACQVLSRAKQYARQIAGDDGVLLAV